MKSVKLIAALFLTGFIFTLSASHRPHPSLDVQPSAPWLCKKDHQGRPCGVQFGVDNQATTTCTLTVARLSPTTSNTVLIYNLSYASGQSGLFALDSLNLQSTITVKGNITGTWNTVAAIGSVSGLAYDSWTKTSTLTNFALFGIPNTCEDVYLVVN